jgi:hypothetical protein
MVFKKSDEYFFSDQFPEKTICDFDFFKIHDSKVDYFNAQILLGISVSVQAGTLKKVSVFVGNDLYYSSEELGYHPLFIVKPATESVFIHVETKPYIKKGQVSCNVYGKYGYLQEPKKCFQVVKKSWFQFW